MARSPQLRGEEANEASVHAARGREGGTERRMGGNLFLFGCHIRPFCRSAALPPSHSGLKLMMANKDSSPLSYLQLPSLHFFPSELIFSVTLNEIFWDGIINWSCAALLQMSSFSFISRPESLMYHYTGYTCGGNHRLGLVFWTSSGIVVVRFCCCIIFSFMRLTQESMMKLTKKKRNVNTSQGKEAVHYKHYVLLD